MKTQIRKVLFLGALLLMIGSPGFAEGTTWSLDDCIRYALDHNIQVQKANLSNDRNSLLYQQAKDNRLPSVSATVRQNFGWGKSVDSQTGEYGNLSGSNSTNLSLSSSVTLYNGSRLNNAIKQNELNLESSKYDSESVKESVEISILNAFLQVLYAEEKVKNAQKQIEATTEQLTLAKERLDLSVISQSDYLQIASELASEKLTLANANSQYTITKVSLMQLMELPVDKNFTVKEPDLSKLLNSTQMPDAAEIYTLALKQKPQIKSAELTTNSSEIDVKQAQAQLLPQLSMDAGITSGYSSAYSSYNFSDQLTNSISPSVGLTLSIPVFQKRQVKSDISISKIGVEDARLDEPTTKRH